MSQSEKYYVAVFVHYNNDDNAFRANGNVKRTPTLIPQTRELVSHFVANRGHNFAAFTTIAFNIFSA
jgi:hypothetical protein